MGTRSTLEKAAVSEIKVLTLLGDINGNKNISGKQSLQSASETFAFFLASDIPHMQFWIIVCKITNNKKHFCNKLQLMWFPVKSIGSYHQGL